MDYATSKRSCDRVNYIAGLRGVRVKTFPVNLNPDKLGNYEIKIPLDKLHKGFCGWKPYSLGFSYEKMTYGLFAFSKKANLTLRNINVICVNNKNILNCKIKGGNVAGFRGGYSYILPSSSSYILPTNFKISGEN